MRIALTFFICCVAFLSLAQVKEDSFSNQKKLIETAVNKSDELLQISPIDSLIYSQKITFPELQAYLFEEKAVRVHYRYKIYGFGRMKDSVEFLRFAEEVLNCYDSAYEKATCIRKPEILYKRFVFLKEQVYLYRQDLNPELSRLYKRDLEALKSMAYVPEKDGYGAGAFVVQGNETWLGLEFSIFSSLTDSKRLEISCNDTLYHTNQNRDFRLYNMLTFSYSRAITSNQNDFSLSLIEFYSPLVILPAKLGVVYNGDLKATSFYYRPTLGIGYKSWSLTYSYNLMFSKQARDWAEKHMLTLRFSSPFTNHRYKTKN